MARLNWLAPAVLAGLLLAGCDGGASAVPMRDQASLSPTGGEEDAAPGGRAARADPGRDSAPLVNGRPMWAASRRYTAREAAERQFERNGNTFKARDLEDYVTRAQTFVSAPPAGSKTLTRANGDRLIYDPRGNVFAVATSDGTPRAMFRPDDGPAYWERVKAREEKRGPDRQDRDDPA